MSAPLAKPEPVTSRLPFASIVASVKAGDEGVTRTKSSVKAKNASLDKQINDGLSSLKSWTAKLEAQESTRRFTPEQAEAILKEGDNRATAITGKITQAAALLGVKVGN